MKHVLATLTATLALAGPAAAQGRQRPPQFVTCDRNHLTSYTGEVTKLERKKGSTRLTISTDADTVETVTLKHAGKGVRGWFFYEGRPFAEADWEAVAPQGKLKKGVRATAWVCDDGSNPKVDWQPPDESGGPRPLE